ncbi:MAG TPA: hypothetical protein VEX39_03105 [Thermoleophilaceae bacterium]|nr:hypothetical protein [Thermoleophilaceae bacterium]
MTDDEKEPAQTSDNQAEGEDDASAEEQGPDAADLDKDPAYEPEDPNLKNIKGG